MNSRELTLGVCLLVLASSGLEAGDVRAAATSAQGLPVDAPRASSPGPEELMQAVRRDLESAVQNHEALADSLPSEHPEGHSAVPDPKSTAIRSSAAEPAAEWESLLSTGNAQVRAWESYFSGGGGPRLRTSLFRLGPHRGHLEGVLAQNGLPPDLLAIAFVESNFAPNAVSPKGATGLWQFMPATAVRYGLEFKPFQDDRIDLEKSTSAAARYLTDLHAKFGDWLLALAAYNAGEAEVESAIAKGKTRDFWALSRLRLLPNETKEYVPKVLAALHVWKNIVAGNPETGLPGTGERASLGHERCVYAITSSR